MDKFDLCIVGAGVVGLAVAYQLSVSARFRNKSIVLLEQESDFGQITSSRNSEVIHAGIYYPVNSLKATLCVKGKELLYAYCRQQGIAHRVTGKIIVGEASATEELCKLMQQARDNGVDDLQLLDEAQLQRLEPAVSGTTALLSPSTGIIDCHHYMQSLLHGAQANGVQFAPRTRVIAIEPSPAGFRIDSSINAASAEESYSFLSAQLVNAAGLEAQALAGLITGVPDSAIPPLFPCKGDYFAYTGKNPFTHLIYPLPEAENRGLGVHGTIDMAGQLKFGPDAEYVEQGNYQIDPGKRAAFASAIRRYFPALDSERLVPAYSGIRPKLAGPGQQAADFSIQSGADYGLPGLVQLFGIESPGLTASLAIGEKVAQLLEK